MVFPLTCCCSAKDHRVSWRQWCFSLASSVRFLLALCLFLPMMSSGKKRRLHGTMQGKALRDGNHIDNHAVIVSSSRFYHNYRHVSNALSVYRTLRRSGVPDSNIVLMLADDIPCNARNPKPNTIFGGSGGESLYGDSAEDGFELDYRGNDVSVANFLRVLSGRHSHGTPHSRKLHSGPNSNVLVYITGHGGDEFFKFQDREEILSHDLAAAFHQMYTAGRYQELLFVADTCQAFTLTRLIEGPNVLSVASSLKEENSYAHHSNSDLGVSVIDRFTHATMEYFKSVGGVKGGLSNRSIKDWVAWCTYSKLLSNVGASDETSRRKIDEVPLSDFFTMRKRLGTTSPAWRFPRPTEHDHKQAWQSNRFEGDDSKGMSLDFSSVSWRVQAMIKGDGTTQWAWREQNSNSLAEGGRDIAGNIPLENVESCQERSRPEPACTPKVLDPVVLAMCSAFFFAVLLSSKRWQAPA